MHFWHSILSKGQHAGYNFILWDCQKLRGWVLKWNVTISCPLSKENLSWLLNSSHGDYKKKKEKKKHLSEVLLWRFVATFFFNFLILKGFCYGWEWGMGWGVEGDGEAIFCLKSNDSVMYTVPPVFWVPRGIKTAGCLGFKCKSPSWICTHLENFEREKLHQRRSWYLGQLGGFDQSRKHIFSSNKIAMAGSSLPSSRICKADGYESV